MAAAYSMDLRTRVLMDGDAGRRSRLSGLLDFYKRAA
jgi:hypothetical protein